MSEGVPAEAIVARILEGGAPLAVRAAAARGALPLPRATLARLYLLLREDTEAEVRAAAEGSLRSIDEGALGEIFADPACPAEVLTHFAGTAARHETLAEKLAFHSAVTDQALQALAEHGSAAVLDLVLTNQERLIASPMLLERLSGNPALRADQRGRILDMLDRFVRGTEIGGPAADGSEEDRTLTADEVAAATRVLEIDAGELIAASEIEGGEEFETAEDPIVRNAYQKIITLNTAQKAILAMKGGREERFILIRDTNKVVSHSVLKNPRLGEQEVESMANMRNVSSEILRAIGNNRDWSKNYAIVSNLVRNPRTPPGVSTNFVSRLTARDLKILGGDRNVPEVVRRMARRTHMLRTQKPATKFGKKK